MFKDIPGKSRTLRGISDLTLVAPVRRGLVPAPDARSYETRLTLLMRSLNTLRYASLEVKPAPAIPDMIDRIRAIHSFRLALLDGPNGMRMLLLSVAFDGGWEPYMRRIWRDLGPLLDVIFCNCESYLLSHRATYADYARWVRGAQLNTEFFYIASPVTVNDLHWLRARERSAPASPAAVGDKALAAQALPGLAALYRLAELYGMPGTPDGDCLQRAARHLLDPLWQRMKAGPTPLLPTAIACRTPTERAAVAWFGPSDDERKAAASAPTKQDPNDDVAAGWQPANTQAGIVQQRGGVQPTHGALLLLALQNAGAVATLIERIGPASLSAQAQSQAHGPWFNLFFTRQGLQLAGLPDGHLACLPPEFLEGMEARAAVLGDLEGHHPQQWTLPERNWPHASAASPPRRVPLSTVHGVVQVLVAAGGSAPGWQAWGTAHPLHAPIEALMDGMPQEAVRLLSVQPMHRNFGAGEVPKPHEHFGFVDGLSNPELPSGPATPRAAWDQWMLGDFLLGHPNSYGDPPLQGGFWRDSSFVVVRKLRQDVAALDKMLGASAATSAAAALMIGRHQDGTNPIDGTPGNAFDYAKDAEGAQCPVHAHVRRANPRVPSRRPGDAALPPGGREDLQVLPRIIRRGMSYGPPTHTAAAGLPPGETDDRGVVFMAYNASIAEQFELIQSWLAGGNSGSKDAYSGQRDPLFAVPRPGDPDRFAFGTSKGAPAPVHLPDRPPVTLQWGVYLFVPSIAALEDLARFARARQAAEATQPPLQEAAALQRAVEAKKGAMLIAKLQAVETSLGTAAAREQWKAALEDLGARQAGVSQWIWTAVRELHGGVLRTPYGVLVGGRERVMEVFDNRMDRYTATGYCPRMDASFGRIYLGLDSGDDYTAQSTAANDAISAIGREPGFDAAFEATATCLRQWQEAAGAEGLSFDVKDLVDEVLAPVCTHFFGLPDPGGTMRPGAWQAQAGQSDGDAPSCPGHFHAPSRYMFQPNPGDAATAMGQKHGQDLKKYVKDRLENGRLREENRSRIGRALRGITDPDRYASTLIGVMMGFLPTVDGNLRGTLYEWVNDRTLWDLQIAWQHSEGTALARAEAVIGPALCRTMQLRPAPELVWRTATERHALGPVDVAPGDRIVVGIVSATQQNLMDGVQGEDGLWPVFGGKRQAADHPTHACPGQAMAMGVMLGVLAALLTVELRPSLSAQVLRLLPGPALAP